MYCKHNAKMHTKTRLAFVLHFHYSMRTLDPNKLTPLQKRALEVIKKQSENGVAYFSYVSLAKAMDTRRRKINRDSARRALQYLKKKNRLTYTSGESHQKSKIILVE